MPYGGIIVLVKERARIILKLFENEILSRKVASEKTV